MAGMAESNFSTLLELYFASFYIKCETASSIATILKCHEIQQTKFVLFP